jgi:hypothetical protein
MTIGRNVLLPARPKRPELDCLRLIFGPSGRLKFEGELLYHAAQEIFVNYQGIGSARDRLQILKSSPLPVQICDMPTSEPKIHGCSEEKVLTDASGTVNCSCKWRVKSPTPSQMNRV